MKVLGSKIGELSTKVDPGVAEQLADDLKKLGEELCKPKPRATWYKAALTSIEETAKVVGQVGLPVLAVTKALFALLA